MSEELDIFLPFADGRGGINVRQIKRYEVIRNGVEVFYDIGDNEVSTPIVGGEGTRAHQLLLNYTA